MVRSKRRGLQRKPKALSKEGLLGQRGVNLIERILLEMGSTWTSGSALEIGIDGYIELFHPASREALGTVVAAQSKALSSFSNETSEGFDYWCDRRDLEYWLRGNMPVILIVSRPATNEAYWISVKDYFTRPVHASSTRAHFSKRLNAFTTHSIAELIALGKPAAAGLYLSPLPRVETLHSNLLPLECFPPRLWIAETPHRSAGEIWAALRESGGTIDGAWALRDKRLYSFHNLTESPWTSVSDRGSCESFDTSEWADSDDADARRLFVRLLNETLRSQVWPDVRYFSGQDCYAFAGTPEEGSKRASYRSLKRDSTLTAVSFRSKTIDARTFQLLRHLAFRGQFRRLDGAWYLEVTPTYRFTYDGVRLDRFHEEWLKTIKRIEGNRAVLSSVLFWADRLCPKKNLFDTGTPPLRFGKLLQFETELGIDDAQWSSVDPAPPRETDGGGLASLLPEMDEAEA